MDNNWETVTIAELSEKIGMGPFGSNIKVETFVPKGVPIISGAHLKGVQVLEKNFNFVTEEHAQRLKNSIVFSGDIIFTHAGNVGQAAMIPYGSKYPYYMISQRQFYMRCNKKRVLPEFVVLFFHSRDGQGKLLANVSQVGVPSIAQPSTYLKKIELCIPDIDTQKRIVNFIFGIEHKIELNNRIIANLEAQAQTFFDEWFMAVDVEFSVGVLSDIAEINPTRSLSKGQMATYIEMSNLSTSNSFPNNWVENTPFNGGMKFKNGDTLIARITPCLENGKTAYISCLEDGEVGFGSTEYVVLSAKPGYCNEMLYFLARNEDFRNYAIQNMNGSSGRQRVSGETIGNYEMAVPTIEASKQFEAVAKPIMDTIHNCAMQNIKLSQTRDTLLPKLMSGEIEVPEEDEGWHQ